MELVTDPQVILLDEVRMGAAGGGTGHLTHGGVTAHIGPGQRGGQTRDQSAGTSGCTAYPDDKLIVGRSRQSRLARQEKRTIVATIHQPSSECFALFDKIMLETLLGACVCALLNADPDRLLSRGYTVFHGTPSQALVHFDQILHQPCPEHYNPADHYLSIANVDFDSGDAIAALAKVKGFAEQFQSSSAGQALNQELQIVKNHPGTPTTAPGYAAGYAPHHRALQPSN